MRFYLCGKRDMGCECSLCRIVQGPSEEQYNLPDKVMEDVKSFAVEKGLKFVATVVIPHHQKLVPRICLSTPVNDEMASVYPIAVIPIADAQTAKLCIIANMDEIKSLIEGWDVEIDYETVLKRSIGMEMTARALHAVGVELGEHQNSSRKGAV